MADPIHGVVLAGGEGTFLHPLVTPNRPKALLPICNTPVVEGAVLELQRAGLTNIVVVVAPESETIFESHIHSMKKKGNDYGNLEVFVRQDHEGTAEILERLNEERELDNDVVVIAGDLVGGIGLVRRVLDRYRRRSDMLTIALKMKSSANNDDDDDDTGGELYGLFPKDDRDERLLALMSSTDLESNLLRIRPSHLQRYNALTIRSDIEDPHIYVMNKIVIGMISKLREISSLRHDLVPAIARKQFQFERKGEYGERFGVSALLVEEDCYIRRVKTVEDYLKTNMDVARGVLDSEGDEGEKGEKGEKVKGGKGKGGKKKPAKLTFASAGERSNVSAGSVLGQNVTAGSKTSVKKSILGSDIELGSNVKLNGCIVMSGTTIHDNVNLSHSIIGCDCEILSDVTLKKCQVAHDTSVASGTEKTDDAITGEVEEEDGLGDDMFEMVV